VSFVIIYTKRYDTENGVYYRMFFLGQNFVSSLICTPKSKKPKNFFQKNFQKTTFFSPATKPWGDFELVWLQKKDTLNIRCERFSSLTFCRVLFLKGRLIDCLLVDENERHVLQCVTAFQLRFTKKYRTNKHMRIL